MHVTMTQIYWLTRLDGIYSAMQAFMIMSVMVFIGSLALIPPVLDVFGSQGAKYLKKARVISFVIFIVSGTGSLLLPTTKEAAAIICIPAIANNPDMQQAANTLPQALNAKAQEWLSDSLKDREKEK